MIQIETSFYTIMCNAMPLNAVKTFMKYLYKSLMRRYKKQSNFFEIQNMPISDINNWLENMYN
jgi:hypothetical protein